MINFYKFLREYLISCWTLWGISCWRYSGTCLFIILYKWHNFCLVRRFYNVSHFVSSYNLWMLHSLVSPVTTRTTSSWMFSTARLFSKVLLSQIILPYLISDRMNWVYMFLSDRRFMEIYNVLDTLFFRALLVIHLICSAHVPSLENIRPRCLCWFTSSIPVFPIKRSGWVGFIRFLLMIRDKVFVMLKSTSHLGPSYKFFLNRCLVQKLCCWDYLLFWIKWYRLQTILYYF